MVAKFVGSPVVKPAHFVELGKLKEWAGKVPESREFKMDDIASGVMFNMVVNRSRLACLVENLPFGVVQVWDATKHVEAKAIGLGAKGFRAILAGLDTDPEPEDPVFQFRDPTGLEVAMELPQEG